MFSLILLVFPVVLFSRCGLWEAFAVSLAEWNGPDGATLLWLTAAPRSHRESSATQPLWWCELVGLYLVNRQTYLEAGSAGCRIDCEIAAV